MLASSALVLLMTPGLAFFYGGMVRAKGVLNMLMMSISAMGVVTVLWVLYGYSLAFGNDVANLFGDPTQYWGLKGLIGGNAAAAVAADPSAGIDAADAVNIPLAGTIPQLGVRRVPADVRDHHRRADLRRGRRPPQVRRAGWCSRACGRRSSTSRSRTGCSRSTAFTGETGGWIANKLKAIDFAGGTAVHINSGTAGLVLAIILGKRKGWPGTPMRPHNLPFVMLGAGLLWFGWYGFNAGSATGVGRHRRRRRSSPRPSPPRPRCWPGCSPRRIRDGNATSLGAASGIVAGLVAITPSCSSVNVARRAGGRLRRRCDLRAGRRPEIQIRL